MTMECKLCEKEDEILIGDLCAACSSKKKCSHCSAPHDGQWSSIDLCDKCASKKLVKTEKKELLEHSGCIGCKKTMDPSDLIKGLCAKCIIAQSRHDESASEAPGGHIDRNGPSKASGLQNLSKDATADKLMSSASSKCNGCNSPKNHSDLKGGLCISCLFDKVADQKLGSNTESRRQENGQSLSTSTVTMNDSIAVHKYMDEKLDLHQKEGVKFIMERCFCDWICNEKTEKDVTGAILAHFMGLGKTLTTIAVLHTLMTLSGLQGDAIASRKKIFHTVVTVPANAVVNWENEITMWTKPTGAPLLVFNISCAKSGYRSREIKKWKVGGGVLLTSHALFVKEASSIAKDPAPQVLVVDEAHKLLKNEETKGADAVRLIETRRKILLTGTPLQNNVTEYYNLINYACPGVLGHMSPSTFDEEYKRPIEHGMYSDSSEGEKKTSTDLQKELFEKFSPHINRKDASLLRRLLPQLHDTLVTIRSSSDQDKLIKTYKNCCEEYGDSNFFRRYHTISPILNHPGCLLSSKGEGSNRLRDVFEKEYKDDSGDESDDEPGTKAPFKAKSAILQRCAQTWKSPKFILMAHVLAMADELKEQVIVFSKCLKTLDLVERLLQVQDWQKEVGSLDYYHGKGGWKRGKDYLRIDGSVESGKRGTIIDSFNKDKAGVRAILISSLAGGIGINLTAATRVVMLDSHFNPSVSSQCISRAWRKGQSKPVHVYRFAISKTLEDAVYKRSENKSVVSSSVIDGMHPLREYTSEECEHINEIRIMETCDHCGQEHELQGAELRKKVKKWKCSLIGKSCNLTKIKTRPAATFETTDPILTKLRDLVNARTRKTPLVVGLYPVQSSRMATQGVFDSILTTKTTTTITSKRPRLS